MVKSLKRQRGMGWFGMLLMLGAIAFMAIVAVKVGPLYMNQMTLARVVKSVAEDPSMGAAEPGVIRAALYARWAVDYINQIDAGDVKIKRTGNGRVLAYDYEARVNLFYNVFVVIHFVGEHPMRNSTNTDV
jgi:hypothetical protein